MIAILIKLEKQAARRKQACQLNKFHHIVIQELQAKVVHILINLNGPNSYNELTGGFSTKGVQSNGGTIQGGLL